MTDIVFRLRTTRPDCDIAVEAAIEIERLRAIEAKIPQMTKEIATMALRQAYGDVQKVCDVLRKIEELAKEGLYRD